MIDAHKQNRNSWLSELETHSKRQLGEHARDKSHDAEVNLLWSDWWLIKIKENLKKKQIKNKKEGKRESAQYAQQPCWEKSINETSPIPLQVMKRFANIDQLHPR